jgi:hypothetical protein
MTAEIAILNKSAVALAADSAVTLQSGSREEKTYDSADKLFELCRHNPIGVMVYNGLSFAEIPLQSLIKRFRTECMRFEKVEDAASEFLRYLNSYGAASPPRVKDDAIRRLVTPVVERIRDRFSTDIQKKFTETREGETPDWHAIAKSTLDASIAIWERIFSGRDDAKFMGDGEFSISDHINSVLTEVVSNQLKIADADQRARVLAITKLALQKDLLSAGCTGIVIAGFGQKELFPTLVSFETDGMVGDRLKYVVKNVKDIDRNGPRAAVIPFAQKEMVDRFLYGLDDDIERFITQFCKRTVTNVREAIVGAIQYDGEEDKTNFEASVQAAEEAFITGLSKDAFQEIRTNSQSEIESLIEFMPKPEMAKMAEALVNLTSIKKRVSRGMDTVGGPIDVAVISQAEGFVWVKRKHYFPADLNPRYFRRVEQQAMEVQNDEKPNTGSARKRGRAKPAKRRNSSRASTGD